MTCLVAGRAPSCTSIGKPEECIASGSEIAGVPRTELRPSLAHEARRGVDTPGALVLRDLRIRTTRARAIDFAAGGDMRRDQRLRRLAVLHPLLERADLVEHARAFAATAVYGVGSSGWSRTSNPPVNRTALMFYPPPPKTMKVSTSSELRCSQPSPIDRRQRRSTAIFRNGYRHNPCHKPF